MTNGKGRPVPPEILASACELAAEATSLLEDAHYVGWRAGRDSGFANGRRAALEETSDMLRRQLAQIEERWRSLDAEMKSVLVATYGGTDEAAVVGAHFGGAGMSLADAIEWIAQQRKKDDPS